MYLDRGSRDAVRRRSTLNQCCGLYTDISDLTKTSWITWASTHTVWTGTSPKGSAEGEDKVSRRRRGKKKHTVFDSQRACPFPSEAQSADASSRGHATSGHHHRHVMEKGDADVNESGTRQQR
eukprot:3927562-Amphidinium_carterae.1